MTGPQTHQEQNEVDKTVRRQPDSKQEHTVQRNELMYFPVNCNQTYNETSTKCTPSGICRESEMYALQALQWLAVDISPGLAAREEQQPG